MEATDSPVEEIQGRENYTLVNIAGHILFDGAAETVNVIHKNNLTKQEVRFADNSGSLRLVLWKQHIGKIK